MYKIKANKDLFDRWDIIGIQVSSFKNIVQNDNVVDEETLNAWYDLVFELTTEILKLRKDTIDYIKAFNKN